MAIAYNRVVGLHTVCLIKTMMVSCLPFCFERLRVFSLNLHAKLKLYAYAGISLVNYKAENYSPNHSIDTEEES